jgi:hypothetical protein
MLPVRVGGDAVRNAGQPRQRTGSDEASVFDPRADSSLIRGAGQVALCGGGDQFRDRIAGRSEEQQVAAQGRPCRLVGEPGDETVGVLVEAGNCLWSGEVFGGEVESVDVTGGGDAEPDVGILLLALQGGGGLG